MKLLIEAVCWFCALMGVLNIVVAVATRDMFNLTLGLGCLFSAYLVRSVR